MLALADEQRISVLRPACPAANDPVAALAGRPDESILVHHVDALLEPEQVGLESGHVGQDELQPLGPAVGEVEDVERRHMQPIHGVQSDGSDRSAPGAMGSANEKVEPTPSSDSTQIRPPC